MVVDMVQCASHFLPDMVRFIPQFGMPGIHVILIGSLHAESILFNLEKFFSESGINIARRTLSMAVTISEYDLPDTFLFSEGTAGILVWQPQETVIVLGQSNSIETSLHTETVAADEIRVTKRPSGGETVILTPATIAFTVARHFPAMIHFRDFFRMVNSEVIEGLSEMGVAGLGSKGISDITIGNRKILGSSMRKVGNKLVYHAVLNVAEDPSLFSRYLRHPRREPDYRAGRMHDEFVTSISKEGYSFTPDELMEMLRSKLASFMMSKSSFTGH
jgi:lipoate-protein ligase A